MGSTGKRKKGNPGGGKQKKKQKKVAPQLRELPLPEEVDGSGQEESDEPLSDEDLEFVQQHKEQLGFLTNLDKETLDRSVKDAQRRDAEGALQRRQDKSDAAAVTEDGDDEAPSAAAEDGDDEMEGLAAYERGPRNAGKVEEKEKSRGLPVKTLDGQLVFERDDEGKRKGPRRAAALQELAKASQAIQVEGVTVEDDLEAALKEREEAQAAAAAQAAAREAAEKRAAAQRARDAQEPPALAALRGIVDKEKRLQKACEAMAMSASKLLAGPEAAVGEFKTLLWLLKDSDMQVQRLAMVTLLAVFKDILPGYRIRPPTEKELQVKVSKDVQKLRDYESALLKHYQAYLKLLLEGALQSQGGTRAGVGHARVAVRCMCQLLTAHPHFNYTSDLMQAVVPRMASSDPEIRGLACTAIRDLLASPETTGRVALDAVQLVADLVKRRKCLCAPQVVQALSVLKFTEIKPRSEEEEEEDKNKKKQGGKAKSKDKKREGKRPLSAIEEEVDRDFKEAEAGPDRRQLAAIQSQMLEALFEVYFRVLKTCTASPALQQSDAVDKAAEQPGSSNRPGSTAAQTGAAGVSSQQQQQAGSHKGKGGGGGIRQQGHDVLLVGAIAPGPGLPRDRMLKKAPLLYPVLEGLGRYAHLISVEYFNDLMAVFHELLRSPGLPLVERLRVLATASDILIGQGEALTVDRKEFHTRLYEALLSLPLAPLLAGDTGGGAQQGQQGTGADEQQDGEGAGGQQHQQAAGGEDDPPGTASLAAVATGHGLLPSSLPASVGGASLAASVVEEPLASLLAAVLSQMLCEPKIIDVARLAAFAKRCASMAMASGTSEALVLLGCVLRLLRRYPRLNSLLDWEGEAPVGGRTYSPDCLDPSEAGALASALWELPFLTHHYHPHVAQAATSLLRGAAGGQGVQVQTTLSGPLATPGTLRDLASVYSRVGRGGFTPSPPQPAAAKAGKGGQRSGLPAGALKRALQAPVSAEFQELCQEVGVPVSASASQPLQGGVNEDEEGEVAAALVQSYRVARRCEVNQGLRRERGRLVDQVKRFQLHLHQQQLQQQQRGQLQARGGPGKQQQQPQPGFKKHKKG